MLTLRFLWLALGSSLLVVLLPGYFWWILALVLALAVVDSLACGSPRRVEIQRLPTDPVRLGEPTSAETVLQSRGRRRLRGWVKDGWQPTAGAEPLQRVDIAAGARLVVSTPLQPSRRGVLTSEYLSIRSVGPLGLAGRQVTHRVPHSQQVLPSFASRKHLPSKLRRLRELEGATAVNLPGAGTEFDSLRDYVRGDDVRSIDWRATARRQDAAGQHLVVRTWRPERDRRVILCLDTSRTSAARLGDEPRLEAGIEASLLLGTLAAQAGDRVEFLAFDRKIGARASTAERGAFLKVLSRAAAHVEPALVEADFSQLPAQIARVTSQKSLVVILTAVDSPSLQEGLLPVLAPLTAKHRVVLASAENPELVQQASARSTAGEVYAAAAAERALLEAEAVSAELAGLGVEVVQADPDRLAPALADCYLRLKAAGRL